MDVTKEEVKEAIRMDHLVKLKSQMAGKKKLEELSRCDLRTAQDYVSWCVEDCRIAFRLQSKMFDCRVNMPARYKRDLACRACRGDPAGELEAQDESQDHRDDAAGRMEECDESQDHLEVCLGYSELWLGLGPMSPLTRVRFSKHRPFGPMLSISRFVHMRVCLRVHF